MRFCSTWVCVASSDTAREACSMDRAVSLEIVATCSMERLISSLAEDCSSDAVAIERTWSEAWSTRLTISARA